MPHIAGAPPICSLEQYYACYEKVIVGAKTKVRKECQCPIPCSFLIFDPTISFATTSIYATSRLLASAGPDVEDKFHRARETTNRMDRKKFEKFENLERRVHDYLNNLKQIMFNEVERNIDEQEHIINTIFSDTMATWTKKMYLYNWQKYIVQKNFMRVREAMEERTFGFLAQGFQEYSYQIEVKIQQLANDSIVSEAVRQSIYLLTLNELYGRVDLAERAFANYTQLYQAYYDAAPVFRYKYFKEPRNDNLFIGPHVLLRDALLHSAYAIRYSGRVGEDIIDFKKALLRYVDLADEAYHNKTLNETELYLANVNFLWRGRRYYHSKSTFYFESIEYPLRILQGRIDKFNDLNKSFHSHWQKMNDDLDSLKFSLQALKKSIINNLDEGLLLANRYFEFGNISKLQVAHALTHQNIFEGISNMKIFFTDVRARGQNVYDGWLDLVQSTTNIWEKVLEDEDMTKYYEYQNMTKFLRNFTDVAENISSHFTEWRSSFDFRFLVGTADSSFLNSLQDLMRLMTSYLDTGKVDSRFIQENFLQLDIFYRERSYEQITQQKAYDLFALLCDIGGSMGLFVGASVLTIFEIVDLFFHQTIYRFTHAEMS